ncbi:MAG: hypothetical protein ACTSR8_12500 [Promethearchaeota archaeon]
MLDKLLSKTKIKDRIEGFVKKNLYGKISANNLTLAGLGCGLLSALSLFLAHVLPFWMELTLAAVFFLIASFILDVFDGALARVESTDPLNLIWPGLFSLGAMVICITMFLIIGTLNSEAFEDSEKLIYFRVGLMERSETFLFFIFIVAFFFLRLALLWIFAILVFITAILRLKDAYNLFYNNKKEIK